MIRRALTVLLLFALQSGCGKRSTAPLEVSKQGSGATQSAAPDPANGVTKSQTANPVASRLPSACRALRVRGRAQADDGKAIETMTPLDGETWLELEPGAEMVIRFPASARELSLSGPGRFLPCRAGMEIVLASRGTFRSSSGTGVRPGTEVWLATPFGSLRYGDAHLEASVGIDRLDLLVTGGSASFHPAPGVRGLPDGTLMPKRPARGFGRPDPVRLTMACKEAAQQAHESALSVVDRTPDAGLGEPAALQLRSRRTARAACETARAGLDREPTAAQRVRLGDQIALADTLWRAIPTAKARDIGELR